MSFVDVLVLTALQDELSAVLAMGEGWETFQDSRGFRYSRRLAKTERGQEFAIAAAWIGAMGPQSASIRGTQLVEELSPELLAMCGVCAGYRKKVALGDVIVADQLYRYDEGKEVKGPGDTSKFYHALRTYDLPAVWKTDASYLAREIDLAGLSKERPPSNEAQRRWMLHTIAKGFLPSEHAERKAACPSYTGILKQLVDGGFVTRSGRTLSLTDAGRDWVDEDFTFHPDGPPEDPKMQIHVGGIATGSAVVEDPAIFEKLRGVVRTTAGLEMEGAALAELAQRYEKRFFFVKAVQDFADHDKDDGFRAFACKASATFLLTFLQKHFEPQRESKRENLDRLERYGRDYEIERENPFLQRVERLVHLRVPGAKLNRKPGDSPWAGVIEVEQDAGGFSRLNLVAALDAPITEELATFFAMKTHEGYRARHPNLQTTLVHQGAEASIGLREWLERRGITLQTFDQYQGLFDLTAYLEAQTDRLGKNAAYLPAHYVPQSAWIKIVGHREPDHTKSALQSIWDLLKSPTQQRFVLVLGEFGAGKTFLLRELCRRMVLDKHPVWPVLLDMSALEKAHDFSELLAAHFAKYDVPGYNYKAFQYMLSEGKIALLFDGFDELADRATYDNAKEHFNTVLSAAQGNAKIVLSSRRQHFLTDGEIHDAVERGFAKDAANALPSAYRLFLLELFGETHIRHYLRNVLVDEAAAEARYRLIDEVKDLLGLSHNPRMLGFIADIPEASLREAKRVKGEITAAGLYELLVTQWLDFEHNRSLRRGAAKGISREALDRGVTALALSMWHSRAKTVQVDEIRDVIAQAMVELGEPALDSAVLTHLFASGSLLVRDAEGRFSFFASVCARMACCAGGGAGAYAGA